MPIWRRQDSRILLAALAVLLLVHFIIRQHQSYSLASAWGPFVPLSLSGFVNSDLPTHEVCPSVHTKDSIAVQKSRYLYDNLTQVAAAVDSHELVVDEYRAKLGKSEEEQRRTRESWARLSGSAVWLTDQQVYLVVSRVIFYAQYNVQYPFRSWLRGQVYDKDWNHLENHTITWGSTSMTFPTIFDVPIDYKKGGVFYGPEDPRVIIERGVDGAEPVIVYNMLTEHLDWYMAMYVYRPFSKTGTILNIADQKMNEAEKNWSPFYIADQSEENNRKPSEYLHFVHTFDPLGIVQCHLTSGICEHTFQKPETRRVTLMRGGTNWFAVPIETAGKDVQAWASFTRTMIGGICGQRFYRPEFTVMVRVKSVFHVAFMSLPMDFGSAVLEPAQTADPCGKGRVLTPLSIAGWDMRPGHDILTATMTVNDATVQVLRLRGLYDFVQKLPMIQRLREGGNIESLQEPKLAEDQNNLIVRCAIEAANIHADLTRLASRRHMWRDEIRDKSGRVIGLQDRAQNEEMWRGEDPYMSSRSYRSPPDIMAAAERLLKEPIIHGAG